jgi:hypothetical protein
MLLPLVQFWASATAANTARTGADRATMRRRLRFILQAPDGENERLRQALRKAKCSRKYSDVIARRHTSSDKRQLGGNPAQTGPESNIVPRSGSAARPPSGDSQTGLEWREGADLNQLAGAENPR